MRGPMITPTTTTCLMASAGKASPALPPDAAMVRSPDRENKQHMLCRFETSLRPLYYLFTPES